MSALAEIFLSSHSIRSTSLILCRNLCDDNEDLLLAGNRYYDGLRIYGEDRCPKRDRQLLAKLPERVAFFILTMRLPPYLD